MIPDTEPKSPREQLRRPKLRSRGSWSVDIWMDHLNKGADDASKKTSDKKEAGIQDEKDRKRKTLRRKK